MDGIENKPIAPVPQGLAPQAGAPTTNRAPLAEKTNAAALPTLQTNPEAAAPNRAFRASKHSSAPTENTQRLSNEILPRKVSDPVPAAAKTPPGAAPNTIQAARALNDLRSNTLTSELTELHQVLRAGGRPLFAVGHWESKPLSNQKEVQANKDLQASTINAFTKMAEKLEAAQLRNLKIPLAKGLTATPSEMIKQATLLLNKMNHLSVEQRASLQIKLETAQKAALLMSKSDLMEAILLHPDAHVWKLLAGAYNNNKETADIVPSLLNAYSKLDQQQPPILPHQKLSMQRNILDFATLLLQENASIPSSYKAHNTLIKQLSDLAKPNRLDSTVLQAKKEELRAAIAAVKPIAPPITTERILSRLETRTAAATANQNAPIDFNLLVDAKKSQDPAQLAATASLQTALEHRPGYHVTDKKAQALYQDLSDAFRASFSSIQQGELDGQAWNSKEKSAVAPNITQHTHLYNSTIHFLTSQILEAKDRDKMLNKMLDASQIALREGNYDLAMAFLATFNASAIGRLKEMKKLESSSRLKTLETMLKTDSNSGRMRAAIKERLAKEKPVEPYLGTYLMDLTFIMDGNPDKVGEQVNLSKLGQIVAVKDELTSIQQGLKSAQPTIPNQTLLESLALTALKWDEKSLYELSLKVQPRKPTT